MTTEPVKVSRLVYPPAPVTVGTLPDHVNPPRLRRRPDARDENAGCFCGDESPVPLRDLFTVVAQLGGVHLQIGRCFLTELEMRGVDKTALDIRLARSSWYTHFRVSKTCHAGRSAASAITAFPQPALIDMIEFYLASGMVSDLAALLWPPATAALTDDQLAALVALGGCLREDRAPSPLFPAVLRCFRLQSRRLFFAAGCCSLLSLRPCLPFFAYLAAAAATDGQIGADVYGAFLCGLYEGNWARSACDVTTVLTETIQREGRDQFWLVPNSRRYLADLVRVVCAADDLHYFINVLCPFFDEACVAPTMVLLKDIAASLSNREHATPTFGRLIPAFLAKVYATSHAALAYVAMGLVANDANIDVFAALVRANVRAMCRSADRSGSFCLRRSLRETILSLPPTPVIRAKILAWTAPIRVRQVGAFEACLAEWLTFHNMPADVVPPSFTEIIRLPRSLFVADTVEASVAHFMGGYGAQVLASINCHTEVDRVFPRALIIRWTHDEYATVMAALKLTPTDYDNRRVTEDLRCRALSRDARRAYKTEVAQVDAREIYFLRACLLHGSWETRDSKALVYAAKLLIHRSTFADELGALTNYGRSGSLLEFSVNILNHHFSLNLRRLRERTFKRLGEIDVRLRDYRARLAGPEGDNNSLFLRCSVAATQRERAAAIDDYCHSLGHVRLLFDVGPLECIFSLYPLENYSKYVNQLVLSVYGTSLFAVAFSPSDVKYLSDVYGPPGHFDAALSAFEHTLCHFYTTGVNCQAVALIRQDIERWRSWLVAVSGRSERDVIDTVCLSEGRVAAGGSVFDDMKYRL